MTTKPQNPGQQGEPRKETDYCKAKNKESSGILGSDKEENPHGNWMIVNKKKKGHHKKDKPERKDRDLPSQNPFHALAHDSVQYKPESSKSKVGSVQDQGHRDSRKPNNSKVAKEYINNVVEAQVAGNQDSNKVTGHVACRRGGPSV